MMIPVIISNFMKMSPEIKKLWHFECNLLGFR